MNARIVVLILIALLAWFGITAQLILHLETPSTGLSESLVRFFSFFTVLTNLLVAMMVTVQLFTPWKSPPGFFHRPAVVTAITVYITLVGVIYNAILRSLWSSSGLQAVLHDILHTAVPLLVLLYWVIWIKTRSLSFKNIGGWSVYPVVYCILLLVLGHHSSWYPYPFFDVGKLGLNRVLVNGVLLLAVFFIFALVFVFIGKRKTQDAWPF